MLSRQALRTFRAAAPVARPLAARRTYAAAAASENVTPPLAVFGIDGTYATALVRLSPVSSPRDVPFPRLCLQLAFSRTERGTDHLPGFPRSLRIFGEETEINGRLTWAFLVL